MTPNASPTPALTSIDASAEQLPEAQIDDELTALTTGEREVDASAPCTDDVHDHDAPADESDQGVHAHHRDDVITLARLTKILDNEAEPELPWPLYRVLSLIARGDARAAKIARKLALGKPSITAAVEALVERGLVVGSEVSGDKRGVHLALTSDGEVALEHAAAHLGGVLDAVIDICTDPTMVREALGQLGVALDERAADRDRRQL